MTLKRTKRNWELFGRNDPLVAILTDPERAETGWDVDEFFLSGRTEVAAHLRDLAAVGIPVARERALDFGCGVGRLTQALCDHFEQCDGVDIATSMIEGARRQNGVGPRCRYHVNDAPDLSVFGDGTFDFVLSIIVLQHIPPVVSKRYIGEFVRVLRPGGVAVFQAPARTLVAPDAPEIPGPGWPRRHSWAGLSRRARQVLAAVRSPRPVMDMYCIPEDEIAAVVLASNGRLVDISPCDVCGPLFESFRYVAVRSP